jgi:hypothetical protein
MNYIFNRSNFFLILTKPFLFHSKCRQIGNSIYCHVLGMCVTYRRGMDWMIVFIDTLYIPLGTKVSYSAIAISTRYCSVLHTLVHSIFTSRILLHRFWIRLLDLLHLYTQLVTTNNTALSLIYTFHFTVTHALGSSSLH